MSQPDGQCHAQELSGVRCLVVRDPRGKASASRPFVCKQHEDAAKKASKEAKADLRLQLQAGQVGNVPALTYGQSGKLIDQITWIAPSSASQPLVVYIFKDTKRHRLESFEAAVQLLLPDILAEESQQAETSTGPGKRSAPSGRPLPKGITYVLGRTKRPYLVRKKFRGTFIIDETHETIEAAQAALQRAAAERKRLQALHTMSKATRSDSGEPSITKRASSASQAFGSQTAWPASRELTPPEEVMIIHSSPQHVHATGNGGNEDKHYAEQAVPGGHETQSWPQELRGGGSSAASPRAQSPTSLHSLLTASAAEVAATLATSAADEESIPLDVLGPAVSLQAGDGTPAAASAGTSPTKGLHKAPEDAAAPMVQGNLDAMQQAIPEMPLINTSHLRGKRKRQFSKPEQEAILSFLKRLRGRDTLPNLERQLSHADDMFQEASIKGTHLAKAFRADIGDDIIAQLLSNPEALEAIKRKHNPRIQECDQQKQQWLKLREQAQRDITNQEYLPELSNEVLQHWDKIQQCLTDQGAPAEHHEQTVPQL